MRTAAWKIDALRGVGLGFIASSVLFVLSGRLEAFSGVVVGAAIGLALGARGTRRVSVPTAATAAPPLMVDPAPSVMQRLLMHRRLAVRFASLLALGLLILALAWALGYWVLPVGVLRGRNAAAALAGESAAYIADIFPARQWTEVRSVRSLAPTLAEAPMAGSAVACVLGAAWVEAFTHV